MVRKSKCIVKGCMPRDHIRSDGTKIVFHNLGVIEKRNPAGFPAFLALLGMQYEQFRDSHFICSRHFSDDAYLPGELSRVANSTKQVTGNPKAPMLKPDAMPTLYLENIQVEKLWIHGKPRTVGGKRKILGPNRARPKKIQVTESGQTAVDSLDDSDLDCGLEQTSSSNKKMKAPNFKDLTGKASSSSAGDPLDIDKIEQEVTAPNEVLFIKGEPLENLESPSKNAPSTSMEKLTGFIDIVDVNAIVSKKYATSPKRTCKKKGRKPIKRNYVARMEDGWIPPLPQKLNTSNAVPISEVPRDLLLKDDAGDVIAFQCKLCESLFISESFFKRHISLDHSEVADDVLTDKKMYYKIRKRFKLPHSSLDMVDKLTTETVNSNESVNFNELIANADGFSIVNSDDLLSMHSQSKVNSEDQLANNSQTGIDGLSMDNSDDQPMVNSDELPRIKFDLSSVNSEKQSIVDSDGINFDESEVNSSGLLIVNSEDDLSRFNDESIVNSDGLSILVIDSSSIDPQFPTESHKKFYSHFCKYHLYNPDAEVLKSQFVFPRLVQPLTSNGLLECSDCRFCHNSMSAIEMHFFNAHSEDVERFGSEILLCRACSMKCHVDILKLADHFQIHRFHYASRIRPEQPWQCSDCNILSAECKELNFLEKSCDVFQFNELTIERKNCLKKTLRNPQGFYFSYTITPNFTFPINKNYNCTVCYRSFETVQQLNSHLEIHIDYEFKNCVECSEKCENMNSYYAHVEKNHKNSTELDLDLRFKTKVFGTDEYSCEVFGCYEKFVNFCSREYHVAVEHSQISMQYQHLKCPICNVIFHDQKLFSAHLAQNCVENTQCQICNVEKENLNQHMLEDHSVQKIFCNICNQNIQSNNSQAIFHFKKCYAASETFICPFCGFEFENIELLLNHIRIDLHSFNATKLQCRMCLNYFHSKLNLVSHMLHSNCIECDQSFCHIDFLVQHRNEVHS